MVAAYDRDYAIILLTDAIERHNHRTRWRQELPMYELMCSSVIERPESYVLTPARDRTSTTGTTTAPTPTPDRLDKPEVKVCSTG